MGNKKAPTTSFEESDSEFSVSLKSSSDLYEGTRIGKDSLKGKIADNGKKVAPLEETPP